MDRHLLILACGSQKRPDAGLLPAVERYTGPMFQTVRSCLPVRGLDIWVLSAEFGLITAEMPIPDYDRKMIPTRAADLRPQIAAFLAERQHHYHETMINLGSTYMLACAPHAGAAMFGTVRHANENNKGFYGQRRSAVGAWLRSR